MTTFRAAVRTAGWRPRPAAAGRRRSVEISRLASGVNPVLQDMRSAKNEDPTRIYRHFLTRLRVAPDALPLVADEEAAERRNLDVLAARQGVGDLLQHGLDQIGRLVPRQTDLLVHRFAQLRSRYRRIHPRPPPTLRIIVEENATLSREVSQLQRDVRSR